MYAFECLDTLVKIQNLESQFPNINFVLEFSVKLKT